MLKLKKLLLKSPQTEQGFTMMEVLIGILITSAFLAVSMQGMVIATFFRVKAQEKQIASQLIQEDVEAVKFTASEFQQDTSDPDALKFDVDSKCAASDYDDGFAKAVANTLPAVPANKKLLGTTGTEFALERIEQTAGSVAPHKILRIKYRVSEWKDGAFAYTDEDEREANAVGKDYIEVIPNAALLCP